MKRIRYLTMLLALLCNVTAWAQEETFNPTSPAEPDQIPQYYKLNLVADPAEAASWLTGDGKYKAGTSVTLNATASSGWKFDNWTDKDGNVVTSPYTTKAEDETLTAHFKYTPDDPDEPGEIAQDVRYWLTLAVEEGGTASGGGRYRVGTKNTVRASAKSEYQFVGWYDSEGENCLSTNASYKVTMVKGGLTLLAKFKYCPPGPAEPARIKGPHNITLKVEEGGTAYASSTRLSEGETATLTASANSGYVFEGWYLDGELYNSKSQITYKMGSEDVTFEARFRYNPSSPEEPTPAKERHYTFYLMNVIGKPGDKVNFPVYLTSKAVSKGMTFQMTFPTELVPANVKAPIMAEAAAGFKVEVADGSDAGEGETAYVYTLSGSELPKGEIALMNFTINIPETQETGKGYPVYLNQVSITNTDGTKETASVRHGRVSVYKNGDSNGDNVVDLKDKANVIAKLRGQNPEVFIEEVSNVNDDGKLNISDAMGIVEIVNGEQ